MTGRFITNSCQRGLLVQKPTKFSKLLNRSFLIICSNVFLLPDYSLNKHTLFYIPAFLTITKLLMEEKHWSCCFHPCSCCRMCLKHFFHQLLATPPNHSNSGWSHQLIEMNIKLNKEINFSSKWVFLLVLLISIEQSWRFLLENWIINSFSSL